MSKGTVKWFNPTKGYGFIQPQGGGGRDVFVHISAVERAGLSSLSEGQVVEYEEVSNRGKTSAENLLGVVAKLGFKAHPHMFRHACGFQLANQGTDTRTLQAYLGHRNIQHTVRYTELSPTRFKNLWRD